MSCKSLFGNVKLSDLGHKQTAAIVKNANSRLGLIIKSSFLLDEETLALVSLVRSKLEYG